MIKQLFNDKGFYKLMLAIALPIALQNLISSSLNLVDTVMIGGLGETEIASVALANQVFFLFVLILFGVNSGSTIFIAQFWGKKDIVNIRRVLGIALISGGVVSLVFFVGAFFAPEFILKIFTTDAEVIRLGSGYLRIVSLSYLATTISLAYGFACRSIGKAKIPMMVSAISLAANTILNYILIFGNFGFAPMGVNGAAIATLVSRLVELLLILVLIYTKVDVLSAKVREMTDLSLDFVKKFFKTTMPVILNEGFWALGMTVYSVAYARIGTEAIAAVQISSTVQNLFMVVAFGLANSCTVMLGNKIGANEEEEAIAYANRFAVLGPAIGILLGMLLYLLSPLVLSLFSISSQAHHQAVNILTVMAIVISIKIFNAIMIVGILRSGGDTKFSLFLEMGSVWLVGVPLAFIGALWLKLPVYLVVAMVSFEELVKAVIGIIRLLSKKWVRNVIEQM